MSNRQEDPVASIRAAERDRIRRIMSGMHATMLPEQAAVLALATAIRTDEAMRVLARAAEMTQAIRGPML